MGYSIRTVQRGDLQAESAVLRPGADLVHRALDHGVDVGGIEIELELAGPELAEIEDLHDQAQESGRVPRPRRVPAARPTRR